MERHWEQDGERRYAIGDNLETVNRWRVMGEMYLRGERVEWMESENGKLEVGGWR